ncbi:hypothetical protein BDV28DRAFT_159317 [Aspergillus coremiiformis]|uniref:Uncharacterized protein n=1 Tax=Aspergillus coremiiformis TaxID=138285 RepID=A0A5N6Z451_9EURO|nr:hypothetical protein BDV28DRAFT_159317 [Aspergillus coremiiformis]
MSTPLSPLTPSRQNSHPFSPGIGDLFVQDDAVENMVPAKDGSENIFSSPGKIVDDLNADTERRQSYTAMQQLSEQDLNYDDTDPILPPSSPFQYEAREDTVDFQMLRRRQMSATPRKRSYEHVPEDENEIQELDDRYKKGATRRDLSDIPVYTDEDDRMNKEQIGRESAGQEIGNSLVEENHNEGMSAVLQENDDKDSLNEKENLSLHDDDDDDEEEVEEKEDDDDDAMNDDAHDSMDDTCLSTFSAVTNVDMTSFANLRNNSPARAVQLLPNQSSFFPRKRYSMQNERYSPSRRSPLRTVQEQTRSPAKVSLLDFDIPAVPTPRSIPSVTPRELESLKSRFLSEISSLKATLSGKEAEVSSLKQAVADAERRVGEASEEVRNEAARREALEIEQTEWQRRGQEMEDVLQSIKAEVLEGEQERDQLTRRVEETEKSKEQLEGRVVELETKLSSACKPASNDNIASESAHHVKTTEETAKEIQDAVEKVAPISEPSQPDISMIAREKDEHEAEKRVLEAQIKGLQQELDTLKDDSERLRDELKSERAEKGELVAAVDEWLAIQQNQPPTQDKPESPKQQMENSPEPVAIEVPSQDLSRSISRSSSSGIRPPSTGSGNGEKRIPKIPAPANRRARGNSGNSGGKSGIAVFTPGRSGIMGSIEKMGRGGV